MPEVRVVADEQHAPVVARRLGQRERIVDVEAARQCRIDDEVAAELHAGQTGRVQCADPRARDDELEGDAELLERAAGDLRLRLAALGEPTIDVGAGVVRLGLAVPEEPELLRHTGKI